MIRKSWYNRFSRQDLKFTLSLLIDCAVYFTMLFPNVLVSSERRLLRELLADLYQLLPQQVELYQDENI